MIIAIEGHDRTGKTTLVNSLQHLLSAQVLQRDRYFSHQVPTQSVERVNWLRKAPVEEVIAEHIRMYKRREEACLSEDIIYIIDRGFLSLLAGSLASIIRQKKCDIVKAFHLFEDIRESLSYEPKKSLEVFLYMPIPLDNCITTIETRNGTALDNSYIQYMHLFVQFLQLIVVLTPNVAKFNCLESPEMVCQAVISFIRRSIGQ